MKNLLEYNGYHAKIEISVEDNIFVGCVLGINDSLIFYGNTISELREAFKNSIDNYIEMCEYYGKTPEKEYSGSFNVRVGSDLHKKIDIASQEQCISINQFIVNTLKDYFNNLKKEIIYIAMPYTTLLRKWQNPVDTTKYADGNDYTNSCIQLQEVSF